MASLPPPCKLFFSTKALSIKGAPLVPDEQARNTLHAELQYRCFEHGGTRQIKRIYDLIHELVLLNPQIRTWINAIKNKLNGLEVTAPMTLSGLSLYQAIFRMSAGQISAARPLIFSWLYYIDSGQASCLERFNQSLDAFAALQPGATVDVPPPFCEEAAPTQKLAALLASITEESHNGLLFILARHVKSHFEHLVIQPYKEHLDSFLSHFEDCFIALKATDARREKRGLYNNLYDALTMCGPGIITQMTDLQQTLYTDLSITAQVAAFREGVINALAEEFNRKVVEAPEGVQGMGVHTLAVFQQNAIALGIGATRAMGKADDPHAASVNFSRYGLSKLYIKFHEQFNVLTFIDSVAANFKQLIFSKALPKLNLQDSSELPAKAQLDDVGLGQEIVIQCNQFLAQLGLDTKVSAASFIDYCVDKNEFVLNVNAINGCAALVAYGMVRAGLATIPGMALTGNSAIALQFRLASGDPSHLYLSNQDNILVFKTTPGPLDMPNDLSVLGAKTVYLSYLRSANLSELLPKFLDEQKDHIDSPALQLCLLELFIEHFLPASMHAQPASRQIADALLRVIQLTTFNHPLSASIYRECGITPHRLFKFLYHNAHFRDALIRLPAEEGQQLLADSLFLTEPTRNNQLTLPVICQQLLSEGPNLLADTAAILARSVITAEAINRSYYFNFGKQNYPCLITDTPLISRIKKTPGLVNLASLLLLSSNGRALLLDNDGALLNLIDKRLLQTVLAQASSLQSLLLCHSTDAVSLLKAHIPEAVKPLTLRAASLYDSAPLALFSPVLTNESQGFESQLVASLSPLALARKADGTTLAQDVLMSRPRLFEVNGMQLFFKADKDIQYQLIQNETIREKLNALIDKKVTNHRFNKCIIIAITLTHLQELAAHDNVNITLNHQAHLARYLAENGAQFTRVNPIKLHAVLGFIENSGVDLVSLYQTLTTESLYRVVSASDVELTDALAKRLVATLSAEPAPNYNELQFRTLLNRYHEHPDIVKALASFVINTPATLSEETLIYLANVLSGKLRSFEPTVAINLLHGLLNNQQVKDKALNYFKELALNVSLMTYPHHRSHEVKRQAIELLLLAGIRLQDILNNETDNNSLSEAVIANPVYQQEVLTDIPLLIAPLNFEESEPLSHALSRLDDYYYPLTANEALWESESFRAAAFVLPLKNLFITLAQKYLSSRPDTAALDALHTVANYLIHLLPDFSQFIQDSLTIQQLQLYTIALTQSVNPDILQEDSICYISNAYLSHPEFHQAPLAKPHLLKVFDFFSDDESEYGKERQIVFVSEAVLSFIVTDEALHARYSELCMERLADMFENNALSLGEKRFALRLLMPLIAKCVAAKEQWPHAVYLPCTIDLLKTLITHTADEVPASDWGLPLKNVIALNILENDPSENADVIADCASLIVEFMTKSNASDSQKVTQALSFIGEFLHLTDEARQTVAKEQLYMCLEIVCPTFTQLVDANQSVLANALLESACQKIFMSPLFALTTSGDLITVIARLKPIAEDNFNDVSLLFKHYFKAHYPANKYALLLELLKAPQTVDADIIETINSPPYWLTPLIRSINQPAELLDALDTLIKSIDEATLKAAIAAIDAAHFTALLNDPALLNSAQFVRLHTQLALPVDETLRGNATKRERITETEAEEESSAATGQECEQPSAKRRNTASSRRGFFASDEQPASREKAGNRGDKRQSDESLPTAKRKKPFSKAEASDTPPSSPPARGTP